LRLAPVVATVCVGFLLNLAALAQVCSSGTCIVASTGDLATMIAAVNAGTANSINVAGGIVIAGQSGGGQRFGNGSTSGAVMFLTLVAVANFNIGSGTSTTIEGQLAG
jgi:hypothetical protein